MCTKNERGQSPEERIRAEVRNGCMTQLFVLVVGGCFVLGLLTSVYRIGFEHGQRAATQSQAE